MKLGVSTLARVGIVTLAMATVPVMLPAQTGGSSSGNAAAASSQMIPGTGMTMAELRDLGYSPQQLNSIEGAQLAQNGAGGSGAMGQNNNAATQNSGSAGQGNNSGMAGNGPTQNAAANPGVATTTGSGGGGWGLWGLVGLLGLFGLARGRRTETARTDRDIRRVA